jgi:hypothetical protein
MTTPLPDLAKSFVPSAGSRPAATALAQISKYFDQFMQQSSAFKPDRHSLIRLLAVSQTVAPLSCPRTQSSAALKSP